MVSLVQYLLLHCLFKNTYCIYIYTIERVVLVLCGLNFVVTVSLMPCLDVIQFLVDQNCRFSWLKHLISTM